jgi:hypothetical protein
MQLLDHLLDQEVAEGDAAQARLAIRDRIEHRRGRVGGLGDRSALRQEIGDRIGDLAGQRDFHEDQRLVDHQRMEEGEAAPVGRRQPSAQIVPAVDRVHRLVADDLLEDVRGRRPVDRSQHQEAAVEPGGEELREVAIHRRKRRIALHPGEYVLAHAHQLERGARRRVEALDQLDAARTRGAMQRHQPGFVGCLAIGVDGPRHDLRIGAEAHREDVEEAGALARIERGVAVEEITRQRDARSLALARQQGLAERREVRRVDRRRRPDPREDSAAALGDALHQVAEKEVVHAGRSPPEARAWPTSRKSIGVKA